VPNDENVQLMRFDAGGFHDFDKRNESSTVKRMRRCRPSADPLSKRNLGERARGGTRLTPEKIRSLRL